MKKKTSLSIDLSVWKEIKKSAIDTGKSIGEFIVMIYVKWKEGRK